jgi:hypothetical protein
MKSFVRGDGRQQKAGGLSALYLALAYLVAMPYFLLAVDYPNVTDPVQKVALLGEHQGSMSAIYLITYVVFGIVLAVLSLTLYRRMKDGAPVLMQAATAVGLIWAFALVASGLVFNFGMETVATLYAGHPDQAVVAWQAIEPVAEGLGGAGGEILGGLWVLLVSCAALRTGGLPRILGWLGVAIGLVGIVSVGPALRDAGMVFGMLQIVWLVWTGIVMLRTTEPMAEPVASGAALGEA